MVRRILRESCRTRILGVVLACPVGFGAAGLHAQQAPSVASWTVLAPPGSPLPPASLSYLDRDSPGRDGSAWQSALYRALDGVQDAREEDDTPWWRSREFLIPAGAAITAGVICLIICGGDDATGQVILEPAMTPIR